MSACVSSWASSLAHPAIILARRRASLVFRVHALSPRSSFTRPSPSGVQLIG